MAQVRVTGSKVHRIWKCAASAVLPQHAMDVDRPEWEPMRTKGQGAHGFLEVVGKVGRGAALADAPADVVPLLEALDLERLPVGLATEVSFAWNWQTGGVRELGRNLPRLPTGAVDYDDQLDRFGGGVDWSCEVPLTIDVMGVAKMVSPGHEIYPPTRGYVGDYKSGHTKYPAPDMFGQTLLAAVCVAKVYGCDDVVVELLHIHDNGGHHAVRRIVNDWDLQAFEAELQTAMEHASLPAADFQKYGLPSAMRPVEGSWCDYCPAYRGCSAKLALVREIPQELVQLGVRPDPESEGLQITPGAITVRNVAAVWMAKERIEGILARIAEECCAVAAFEEIPLPDGRVLGRLVTERRALNGKVAAELLRERYGTAAAQFIEESVTLAAMRQAVVKHIRPGEKIETKAKTGMYDRLLVEVEQRGGLELKVTDAVRPHVPKKKPG